MRNTKRRDTKPEIELRSALHRLGFRFRVDVPVNGSRRRSDIVLTSDRVVVYVDGCFWHGCPEHGTVPKQNRQWWIDKLEANRRATTTPMPTLSPMAGPCCGSGSTRTRSQRRRSYKTSWFPDVNPLVERRRDRGDDSLRRHTPSRRCRHAHFGLAVRQPPWGGLMKESAKGWRSWNRFDWSEALLEHYFGSTESTDPVRALVVVGEELVRVVGDPEAHSLEVENLLVERVLRGVGDNNFWFHAKTAAGSSKPHYLGHLITACLAATDLDDGDENSYITRLADVTGSARGDLNLEVMAELWRHLSVWLEEHSDQYRPLVLPDPGGWTRIGYTVKLAFPSRRDQLALAKILSSGNLTVEDPPVGLVIDAVIGASRTAFSDRFRVEFDAFRRNRDAGLSSSVLHESPFWLAVRATADISVSDRDGTVHWALLAADDGFDLDLQVVSDGEVIGGPLETVEFDERIGRWTHEAKGNPSNDDPVAVLLDGVCSLPAISLLVEGGLIPLVEELHGNLESNGRREALPEAHAALVSDPLVAEVTSRFGSPRSRPRACGSRAGSSSKG